MITKSSDIKLVVQPIMLAMQHLYRYEGPCRFGTGQALEPEFDAFQVETQWNMFKDIISQRLETDLADYVEVMEPMRFVRTDNWEIREEMFEKIQETTNRADFYLFMGGLGVYDLVLEFGERFDKPFSCLPEYLNPGARSVVGAALAARDRKSEYFGFIDWDDLYRCVKLLRARKVIRNTRMLQLVRFNSAISMTCIDTFPNLTEISERFGVRFRQMNAHEFMDQLSPAQPGGNPTTPGRETWDLTDEDRAKAEELADNLIDNAVETHVERDYVINSVKTYLAVKKHMDRCDCNCFSAPCPDLCSTRRLDEQKFTFCMTHSLLMREGIASACEYDICAALSQQLLIAVTGMNPYMGNMSPVIPVDGEWREPQVGPDRPKEALLPKLDGYKGTLYTLHHSVPHSRMADPTTDSPYSLRHFAYDAGFGAVFRYDFDADAGKKITLCRIAPDGKHIMIISGEIVCGGGYNLNNCNTQVFFKVGSTREVFEKQSTFGNHFVMVMGDFVQDVVDLSKLLGLEVVLA